MNSTQAWQATLGQLQMEMSKAAFDTWVRSAELVSHRDDLFTIGVPNAYARDWLENRLASTVSRILSGLFERPQQVRFIVWHRDFEGSDAEDGTQEEELPEEETPLKPNPTINARYTFETFVV
ncbi:MAG: DnaA N-terminal domain-containing protein, partial [Anaerolineales bacterium]